MSEMSLTLSGYTLEFDDDFHNLDAWDEKTASERIDYLRERLEFEIEFVYNGGKRSIAPDTIEVFGPNNQRFKLEDVAAMTSSELILRNLIRI